MISSSSVDIIGHLAFRQGQIYVVDAASAVRTLIDSVLI